jgi:hypothetical protein
MLKLLFCFNFILCTADIIAYHTENTKVRKTGEYLLIWILHYDVESQHNVGNVCDAPSLGNPKEGFFLVKNAEIVMVCTGFYRIFSGWF